MINLLALKQTTKGIFSTFAFCKIDLVEEVSKKLRKVL